jgi:hypothetical protein
MQVDGGGRGNIWRKRRGRWEEWRVLGMGGIVEDREVL